MVNADGGVAGRPIELDTRDLETGRGAQAAVDDLRRSGASAIVGSFSSDLSISVSGAAARDGVVYWEAGAVADRITGQGSSLVFRVGAAGANLGGNAARFAVEQLAPKLGKQPSALRAFLVTVNDAYGHSVADATRASLIARGLPPPGEAIYDPYLPDWPSVVGAVRDSHADLLVLSSHIPDGIAFRRAFLAAGLHVDAFIGSTMAQCLPDFGAALGADAVGVFASDRPDGGFNAAALSTQGKALYDRFAAVWRQRTGQAAPSEGGLAGFSAGWALFHIVLPRAAAGHDLSPAAIAAAARSVDLPEGSLANGAGIRFTTSRDRMGQNLRAAAVIWQWQAVRHSVVVWPPTYATGTVRFVPLPR